MPEPSSILHVGKFYPPHPGGMETHLKSLVAYQSRQARVEVLVSNNTRHPLTQQLDGGRITRLATYGHIASMPITPALLTRLRHRNDDIVHLHMPNPAAAAAYLASGHPGKLILTHHGDTIGRSLLRRLSDPFVKRTMERAAAIIVGSQRYLDSSLELKDFRDRCRVIPLGIDPPQNCLVDPAQVERIQSRYGRRIVLAVGRLVAYKGFEVLIRALSATDATLLLIGKGPLLSRLQAVAQEVGVAERVHFLGYVDNLQPYFHAATIFVLPSISRAESFGLVQLEAMAAGLPVVNTDLPSAVPEISLHGITGLTVPPGDPLAMAQAVRLLLQDDALRTRFSQAAILRATDYSSAKMCLHISRIYNQSFNAVKG
jgi:glycosyltransferase involved in cell wall biosynthesis